MPNKIRIAFDGNEANVENRVGSNVYAFEVLRNLEKVTYSNPGVKVTVLLSRTPIKDLPSPRLRWDYKVISPTQFWTQWALPLFLFRNGDKFDVLFSPGHYAPRICPVPYVSSVMDLAFLTYPKQFKKRDLAQLKSWTAYSVKKARKVVAISNFTKLDIVNRYSKAEEDIVVAFPAVPKVNKRISKSLIKTRLSSLKITEPYFLYVGTFQPRKNITTIIEAFESLQRSLKSGALKNKGIKNKTQLVLAGKIGWLAADILKRIEESPYKKHIITPGFVDEKTKMILIKQATALIQVGLYEGFGITPLEALKLGTIPIVSDSTSLPEVVGRAGLRVYAESSISLANAMKKTLNLSSREKAQYKKLARAQAKKFNWEKTAQIILDTLLKVASKP